MFYLYTYVMSEALRVSIFAAGVRPSRRLEPTYRTNEDAGSRARARASGARSLAEEARGLVRTVRAHAAAAARLQEFEGVHKAIPGSGCAD